MWLFPPGTVPSYQLQRPALTPLSSLVTEGLLSPHPAMHLAHAQPTPSLNWVPCPGLSSVLSWALAPGFPRELQPAQWLLIKQQRLDSHPELGGTGRSSSPPHPLAGFPSHFIDKVTRVGEAMRPV